MKNIRVNLVISVAAIAVFASAVSFAARNSRSQSQNSKTETQVKPTGLVAEPRNSVSDNASPAFAAAAAKNAVLENELTWTFGGKQQRGWYLYDLLIGRTLNTRNQADSNDFAAALATWQQNKRLNPDGMLNEESFMAMVSEWQNNRLKNRAPAEPGQLLTAPSSDFYVGGDPVDTKDSNRAIQVKTPVYQWLVLNAERFGFRPYLYEPWHWEYVK